MHKVRKVDVPLLQIGEGRFGNVKTGWGIFFVRFVVKQKETTKNTKAGTKNTKSIRANPFNLRIPCAILFVFPALLGMSETQKGEFRTRPYNP